jgi:hypothetical protein
VRAEARGRGVASAGQGLHGETQGHVLRGVPLGPHHLLRRGAWPVAAEVRSHGDDPLARN